METTEFERIVEEQFDTLPGRFRDAIENVQIVVEDRPSSASGRPSGIRDGSLLLGLYQGIPLNRRGMSYGVYPVVPDKITLFRQNIERITSSERELREKIREVLLHEIGHYFGMTEEEIRQAGY